VVVVAVNVGELWWWLLKQMLDMLTSHPARFVQWKSQEQNQ
jgi:hypothetical protein